MDSPSVQGEDDQQQGVFCGGYTFHLTLGLADGKGGLTITATKEASLPTTGLFKVGVPESSIDQLTHRLCTRPAHLRDALLLALRQSSGWSATITVNNGESSKDGQQTMVLEVEFASFRRERFTITLTATPVDQSDVIAYLLRSVGLRSNDAFSDKQGQRHANLDLFHRGRAVVKARGNATHDSVTTGVQYSTGRHYLEFRIIRSTSNYCMIGVQEEPGALTPYAGHATFTTGKSIYGHNGHCYQAGSSADYGIGGFGPGDYVGVELDMHARRVTFFINGRSGAALPLTGNAYYFVANVYSAGDAVKIVPKYCWHEY